MSGQTAFNSHHLHCTTKTHVVRTCCNVIVLCHIASNYIWYKSSYYKTTQFYICLSEKTLVIFLVKVRCLLWYCDSLNCSMLFGCPLTLTLSRASPTDKHHLVCVGDFPRVKSYVQMFLTDLHVSHLDHATTKSKQSWFQEETSALPVHKLFTVTWDKTTLCEQSKQSHR